MIFLAGLRLMAAGVGVEVKKAGLYQSKCFRVCQNEAAGVWTCAMLESPGDDLKVCHSLRIKLVPRGACPVVAAEPAPSHRHGTVRPFAGGRRGGSLGFSSPFCRSVARHGRGPG